ncbi:MAG: glycosyltransferase family 4 protein [Anaerolineae bacterium]|jgi:glycosyltransferase involved in cell wall biosynthesis
MRVLMISKACVVGAYQRKLEEIARFPDVDLMVIVPPSWQEDGRVVSLERAHTEGYKLVVEPLVFNGSFHLHFYPRLRQRLHTFAPDVVHIDEEPYNLATFHALWLTKQTGAGALWFSWQNLDRRYPLPFRLIERYCLRRADYAIAGSEGAAQIWRRKGYSGPMAVIPQFGVDPDIFAPSPSIGLGQPSSSQLDTGLARRDPAQGFVIGYVGRLVPEKGVDLLLDAVKDLQGIWRLHIVGEGPELGALKIQARRLGLGSRVTLEEGWLPSLRMPAFYRQLDALVLPSRSRPNWVEQFGRVLIESMACGVPVVGSDCGEIPNVIGDAGLVFPEDDAEALRECLTRLMRDPDLWSSLARRGRERVLDRFTQKRIAAQTVAVYREVSDR